MPFTPSHQSPITKRYYISGDMEGRSADLKKFTEYQQELDSSYQPAITSSSSSSSSSSSPIINVEIINVGDWTDNGENPLEVTTALAQMRTIPGNRDLNYMRFLYELDADYINWTYASYEKIQTGKEGDYKNFYDKGTLKTGKDLLIAAEEDARFRFKKNGYDLPLAWVDPPRPGEVNPDFRTWVDKELKKLGSQQFTQQSNRTKEVLYLRYMNECTRGAPDAFMFWAIDLANRADKNKTNDFKKTALGQYELLKKSKNDGEYQERYLTLRKHLNKGFGLNYAKNGLDNLDDYEGSFESEVLTFFKKPTEIIELLKKTEIAITLGTDNNKVLLVHGGITLPEDLSLPDGQAPAKTIDEFVSRFNNLRDRFIALYENASRTQEDERDYIHLARGLALMGLDRGALKQANFYDFPHLNGATASVPNTATVDTSVKDIYTGYVGQINGHTPSRGFFAAKLLGDKFKLGIDTTRNNVGQAVTISTVYEHDDGAHTVVVHMKDSEGKKRHIEVGTFDEKGFRIWPTDPNKRIEQILLGETVELTDDEYASLTDNKSGKDLINGLDENERPAAIADFKKGWKVQFHENGKMFLHKGGIFFKQNKQPVYWNSTVSLDYKVVAERTKKIDEIEIAGYSAGRRASFSTNDLYAEYSTSLLKNDVNTLEVLVDRMRTFKAQINQHRYPTLDKIRSLYFTKTWLKCLDPTIIKAQNLIEILAPTNTPESLVKMIKDFNGFLTSAFGENNLEDWNQTTLPYVLSEAFNAKFARLTILTGGKTPLEQADDIYKSIGEYEPCLESDEAKEYFRTRCFKFVRAMLLLELENQKPADNPTNRDQEYGELERYIEKLNSIKKHPLFNIHCNHHWWEGAFGKTATRGKINEMIAQAHNRITILPAPTPVVLPTLSK